jgi:uncharacterized protein YyaL (SSP411 family)
VIERLAELLARHPNAVGHLLGVADGVVHGAIEVAIVGTPESTRFGDLVRQTAHVYLPSLVLAGSAAGDGAQRIALLRDRGAVGDATAYVCRRYVCEVPAHDPSQLADQLARAVATPGG